MAEKVTHIRLKWAGGVHRFKLDFDPPPFPESRTQPLVFGGAFPKLHDRERAILGRLVSGEWGIEDIENTIRCGLIGGGGFARKPVRERLSGFSNWGWPEVDQLLTEHVRRRPLAESVPLAQTVLVAAIMGVDPKLAEKGLDPLTFSDDVLAAGEEA